MQHLCRKHFITANRASLAILLLQTAATLSFLRNWLILNLVATVLGGKDFENRGRLISEAVLNAQSEIVVSPPPVANDNLVIIPLEHSHARRIAGVLSFTWVYGTVQC